MIWIIAGLLVVVLAVAHVRLRPTLVHCKPTTLDEVVDEVVSGLAGDALGFIRGASKPSDVHHTIGRGMRNGYGLWDPDSVLATHFREVHRLGHPDDMSGLIMTYVWAKVRGDEVDYKAEISRYHDHWARYNTDPVTMETLA